MKGKKNAYACPECGSVIITIDRDEGTTPMLLACRFSGRPCKGMMQSQFYKINQQLRADYQWVRPSKGQLAVFTREKNKGMLEHCRSGGLILKPWRRYSSAGCETAFDKFCRQETAQPQPPQP